MKLFAASSIVVAVASGGGVDAMSFNCCNAATCGPDMFPANIVASIPVPAEVLTPEAPVTSEARSSSGTICCGVQDVDFDPSFASVSWRALQ